MNDRSSKLQGVRGNHDWMMSHARVQCGVFVSSAYADV